MQTCQRGLIGGSTLHKDDSSAVKGTSVGEGEAGAIGTGGLDKDIGEMRAGRVARIGIDVRVGEGKGFCSSESWVGIGVGRGGGMETCG